MSTENWIGYRWLARQYGIDPVQPYPIESLIGATRRRSSHDGRVRETYPPAFRPDDTLAGHLTFALKHEGVFLELLARLFEVAPAQNALEQWVLAERTGQYARRAGFLYEWITGRTFADVPDVTNGRYIDALDDQRYVVATTPANNPRWRVRDNLPGTRLLCPTIRRTDPVRRAETYDIAQQIDDLQAEYGLDILRRSAVWLTLKESRASFLIEHEQDQTDRIRRFAAVMESRIGAYDAPLSLAALTELQHEIIGPVTTLTHFGLRQSPAFVGSTEHFRNVIHYIAPHWDALDGMIDGLEAFLARTHGVSPITRAAVAAFGFVYIHPFADGNGRLHRFLINDILRRDGAVPAPYVLPVSATITGKAQLLAAYDQVLETFSRPLMKRYELFADFRERHEYSDGVRSDFVFTEYDDASAAWRFLDLTGHVEYLADLIDQTIRQEMRAEADLLRRWETARKAVKNIVEGPNQDIDRIIRAIRENNGILSNKLLKEFPVLETIGLGERITAAIHEAFI